MSLASGTRIGTYEVVELLGAGGMGEVYRARDSKLQRDVALKLIPDLFVADPERLARFRREAQVLASLNHPNIGSIYGLDDTGGRPALVLELVDGPTLADRLQRGPLSIDEALELARQITDALEAAHEQGVIHRDLKPANIKIKADGTVKVLDFGLAKALDVAPSGSVEAMNSPTLTAMGTRLGVIVGTAAYMSPEQARGKSVDRRADIWAFGAVFYEMLAGRPAFDGDTVTDILAGVVQRDPDWTKLPALVPLRIRHLLRRCLEKDPKRRLRDIGDARYEIVEQIAGVPEVGAPAERRQPTRIRLLWPAVFVVAATIGIAAAARWLRPAPDAGPVTRLDLATPATDESAVFALSPDGRRIVFVADLLGESQRLWIRSMDEAVARPIAGTEDGTQPFWAPSGRSIGFFAGGHLKRLDFDTGLVRVLAPAPAPRGGTWSQNGLIVFTPNTTSGLVRVPADGGDGTPLTHVGAAQYSHRWPQFLPDGKRVLFSTFLGRSETRGLFLVSVDGGEPQRLIPGDQVGDCAPLYESGYLLTVSQGLLLARRFDPGHPSSSGTAVPIAENVGIDIAMFRGAMSASPNGVLAHRPGGVERRQLVWLDRGGRVMGRIGPPDDSGLAYPSLTTDGHRVAVSRGVNANADIWLVDVNRGTYSRFTSDPSNDLSPVWSPDGSRVVFRTARVGSFDLFLKAITDPGQEEQALIVDKHTKSPLDWSPDGRVVLYAALGDTTGADLWAVPVTGDRKPFPVLVTPFDEMDAHFSPDGRAIVYRSNESGRFEIYIRPFPTGGTSQLVSTAGGSAPRWNPNGKEVFYVSPDGQMMSVAVEHANGAWSVSGTPTALFPIHLASGSFITTAGGIARAQYDVARDGRFLANVAVEGYTAPPISIVLNWDALVKR